LLEKKGALVPFAEKEQHPSPLKSKGRRFKRKHAITTNSTEKGRRTSSGGKKLSKKRASSFVENPARKKDLRTRNRHFWFRGKKKERHVSKDKKRMPRARKGKKKRVKKFKKAASVGRGGGRRLKGKNQNVPDGCSPGTDTLSLFVRKKRPCYPKRGTIHAAGYTSKGASVSTVRGGKNGDDRVRERGLDASWS